MDFEWIFAIHYLKLLGPVCTVESHMHNGKLEYSLMVGSSLLLPSHRPVHVMVKEIAE